MEAAINGSVLKAGDVEVRRSEFLAVAGDRRLSLTVRELDLLSALVAREGKIVSRRELYDAVWEGPYRKADRSVDVYIGRLRQKLGQALPGVHLIHTHFGFGYRFQQEAHSERYSHRFHIRATNR